MAAWVSRARRGVYRVHEGKTEIGGYENLPLRTSRRSRFGKGGVGYEFVDVPLDGADNHSWREDGFVDLCGGLRLI